MSRKKKKSPKIPNKYVISIGIAVLLAVLGLINPQWRSAVEEVLGKPNSPISDSADIFDGSPLPSKNPNSLQAGVWQVVHIADGDTFDVVDNTNTKYKIRLVGADTPETVKPNTPVEPYGLEASAFTKQMIAASGNRVRIAFDGEQIDKYGRTLSFVYLQLPQGEVCLNELLVREGLARALLQYRFSKEAKQRLQQAENEAKQARKNIWSAAGNR
ncbi:thermonuclease [Planctomycetales bacterium]|nr:thermonuclease [Planctomycetales bacterium]